MATTDARADTSNMKHPDGVHGRNLRTLGSFGGLDATTEDALIQGLLMQLPEGLTKEAAATMAKVHELKFLIEVTKDPDRLAKIQERLGNAVQIASEGLDEDTKTAAAHAGALAVAMEVVKDTGKALKAPANKMFEEDELSKINAAAGGSTT